MNCLFPYNKEFFSTAKLLIIFLLIFTGSAFGQVHQFGDYMQFGKLEIEKKNYKEAIRYLNTAIEHRPASYEGYFLRGKAKYHLGDYLGAEKDFTTATNFDPYNPEIYHYRAIVRSKQLNFGGALKDYSTAIRINPKMPLYYLNKARAFLILQDYDSAIIYLNKTIDRKYKNEDVYLLRGIAYSGLEEYDKALADLNKAIQINPKHTGSFVHRGTVRLEMNQPDSAILDFDRAIDQNPGDSYALFSRALARIDLADTSGAFHDLDAVIEYSPYNSYAYYNRAILKLGSGDEKGAIADLDKVITLNPDNIVVYLYRGRIKRSTGDLKGALADFNKAIEIYPEFSDAYYERSLTKEQLRDYKGAQDDHKLAFLINEFNFERRENMALDEEMYLRRLLTFSGEFRDKGKDESDYFTDEISLQPIFFAVLFAGKVDQVRFYDTFSKKNYHTEVITVTNQPGIVNVSRAESELLKNQEEKSPGDKYLLKKAGLYADIQDYSSALANFNKTIDANPELVMAWFGRANTRLKLIELLNSEFDDQYLFDQNTAIRKFDPYEQTSAIHTYEQVLHDYNEALELDPDFPYAWYNRGFVKCLLGDYWGAVSDFSKAIDLKPDFAEAHYNKGLVLVFQQLNSVGCSSLSQAGELGLSEAYGIIKRYCGR